MISLPVCLCGLCVVVACVYVCVYVCGSMFSLPVCLCDLCAMGVVKRGHLLELGIQTCVSHHVGAATGSEVLEKQRVLVIMKSSLQPKGTFSIPAQDFVDKIKVLKILSYFKFWTVLVFFVLFCF